MMQAIGNLVGRFVGWLATPQPPPPHEYAPLIIDDNGWLQGEGVVHIKSHPTWHYGSLRTPNSEPTAAVIHYTATKPGTGINMAKRRARKFGLEPDDREASWHVTIEQQDLIIQQVSFKAGCWHAASTTAKQIPGAGWANRVAASIELVGDAKTKWTEFQQQSACRIWRALVQHYGIPRELAMVPHSAIDPSRKTDPGERWMTKVAPVVLDYAYRRTVA